MYKGKSILALITARGGSKGIPGKNIADLGGKPLIAWTIEAGLESKYIDRLILSSDDEEIIKVSKNFGCEVPFIRPAELALDTTSSMAVIFHALETIEEKYDILVLLQPTSPFRNAVHIDEAIVQCVDNNSVMAVSVSKVKKSPMLMYYKDHEDLLVPVIGYATATRRQDEKTIYEFNGAIYVSDIDFLKEVKTFVAPGVKGIELQDYVDIDIDEPHDLEFARLVAQKMLSK